MNIAFVLRGRRDGAQGAHFFFFFFLFFPSGGVKDALGGEGVGACISWLENEKPLRRWHE